MKCKVVFTDSPGHGLHSSTIPAVCFRCMFITVGLMKAVSRGGGGRENMC